jgi:hypothetical protein
MTDDNYRIWHFVARRGRAVLFSTSVAAAEYASARDEVVRIAGRNYGLKPGEYSLSQVRDVELEHAQQETKSTRVSKTVADGAAEYDRIFGRAYDD